MRLVRIDIKPLSVNECWQGKRYKTKKYKKYESDLLFLLPNLILPKKPYQLFIKVGFSNKLSDIDNIAKPFIDILQKKYNFNDRDIYKLIIERDCVSTSNEYIFFEITNI